MTPPTTHRTTVTTSSALPLIVVCAVVVSIALAYGSLRSGHAIAGTGTGTGTGQELPENPFEALFAAAGGSVMWPSESTVVFAGAALIVLGLIGGGAAATRAPRPDPSAADTVGDRIDSGQRVVTAWKDTRPFPLAAPQTGTTPPAEGGASAW